MAVSSVDEGMFNKKDLFEELNKIKPSDDPAIFFHFVKVFFANYFRIKYEYTYEELEKEIEKRKVRPNLKQKILVFSEKISTFAYGGEKISPAEMKKTMDEFRLIIQELIKKVIPFSKKKENVAEQYVRRKFIKEEKAKWGKERLLALRAKYAFDKLKTKIIPKKLEEAQVMLDEKLLENEKHRLEEEALQEIREDKHGSRFMQKVKSSPLVRLLNEKKLMIEQQQLVKQQQKILEEKEKLRKQKSLLARRRMIEHERSLQLERERIEEAKLRIKKRELKEKEEKFKIFKKKFDAKKKKASEEELKRINDKELHIKRLRNELIEKENDLKIKLGEIRAEEPIDEKSLKDRLLHRLKPSMFYSHEERLQSEKENIHIQLKKDLDKEIEKALKKRLKEIEKKTREREALHDKLERQRVVEMEKALLKERQDRENLFRLQEQRLNDREAALIRREQDTERLLKIKEQEMLKNIEQKEQEKYGAIEEKTEDIEKRLALEEKERKNLEEKERIIQLEQKRYEEKSRLLDRLEQDEDRINKLEEEKAEKQRKELEEELREKKRQQENLLKIKEEELKALFQSRHDDFKKEYDEKLKLSEKEKNEYKIKLDEIAEKRRGSIDQLQSEEADKAKIRGLIKESEKRSPSARDFLNRLRGIHPKGVKEEIRQLMLASVNAVSKNEFNEAKDKYGKMKKLYEKLSLDEQESLHKDILQIYQLIDSRHQAEKKVKPIMREDQEFLKDIRDAVIKVPHTFTAKAPMQNASVEQVRKLISMTVALAEKKKHNEVISYYNTISNLYTKLPFEQRMQVHDEIMELYKRTTPESKLN